MISRHLAQSLLHDWLDYLQICSMDDLLIKEGIENGPQQLLVVNLLNSMSLHCSDPQHFIASIIYLCSQLISFLVIVVYHLLYLLNGRSLL